MQLSLILKGALVKKKIILVPAKCKSFEKSP
jgi:hypothetical protein